MKVCKVCGSSENGFLPRKASKDGLQFLCKICLKKQRKEWYFKNRSERLAYSKQWRKQHPESATMKWNANHPERMKEIRLASYQNNIELAKEQMKKWKLDHPENTKAASAKRRALKKATNNCAGADMKLLRLIYLYCPNGYHVDHIIPLSKGGTHHPNNLQYLPALINLQKSVRLDFDCSKYVIAWKSLIETKGEENIL